MLAAGGKRNGGIMVRGLRSLGDNKTAAVRGGTILGVVALALLLGGCDKCGDWFGISKSQVCRDVAPRQQ
jgi:hypothetical protein